jgi:folate-dependent phosphoribosylglycinamide formyltransferase PurN
VSENIEIKKNIVLLCSNGDSTRAVYQALKEKFGEIAVIMEEDVPRSLFLKRRLKKLGFVTVFGQLIFMTAVVPILRALSRKRRDELKKELIIPEIENLVRIDSVNSESGRDELRKINPKIVVVNGTRIIGKETLQCVGAKFINMHAGITPLYRGVHGGYWALAESKPNLVGTTVHFVDTGIDTGNIIGQAFFEVEKRDNFTTYPYLHTKAGIPLLLKTVELALGENLNVEVKEPALPSRLRYHPTIWEYFYYLTWRGIK